MSDDLKPCPFCTEGKSVSTYFDHEQGDKWGYAACDACESRGPEVRTGYDPADDAPWRAEAIAAWNTRIPDPSIEALTEQLEAARADAKEAEAYADELAGDQVDLCRQLIAAEDKLTKAVELLTVCRDMFDEVAHPSDPLSRLLNDFLAEIEGEKA
jgi:Lar family restriction alleviation protein